jgi:hypothetical protein
LTLRHYSPEGEVHYEYTIPPQENVTR